MRLWIAITILALCSTARAADPAPASASEAEAIASWVKKLGGPKFKDREEATQALLKIGPVALPALEAGTQNRNRELVIRAQRLIKVLKERELETRIQTFLTDRDPEQGHGLAGWDRFRKLVGSSPDAKQLFAEIQRCEGDLLATEAQGPRAAGTALQTRANVLFQNQQLGQPIPLGDVAGVLFFAVSRDVIVNDESAQQLYGFCHQPSVTAALQNEPRREAIKALLGAWVARTASDTTLEQGLQLAIQHELPQGLVPATRVLQQQYGMPPAQTHPSHLLHYALVVMGKHGTSKQIELIEMALDDTTVCMQLQQGDVRYVAQVRDVALSALLDLTKQDCTKYGLPSRAGIPHYHFNPVALGFKTDADRSTALVKWREYRAGMK